MHSPAGARRSTISIAAALFALSASVVAVSASASASTPGPRPKAGHAITCAANQLSATLDTAPGYAAAASRELEATVVVVNTSRVSCALEGWPALKLVAESGASRAVAQEDTVLGAFGSIEPSLVTLRPGDAAAFFVAAPRVAGCSNPFELRVGTSTLDLAASGLRICDATERIQVSAVHPAQIRLFQDFPASTSSPDPAALQRPFFATCRAPQLREVRSTVVRHGSTGEEEVELLLRNSGTSCSLLSRWPVVSLIGIDGSVLVPAMRDEALLPDDVVGLGGSQSPPRYLDLGRGATAMFDILVADPGAPAGCRRATTIEVRFDVTPGLRWTDDSAATYRPAVGIPSCAGAETLAARPSVSVTPVTALHDAARRGGAAAAPNDATGFGWGGDSSGGVCTGGTYPYRVEGLAKYGITGHCAGYFGQVGAAWSQWPGCPDSGWGWNATDAAEAAANYPKYGIGNAFIYFTGGPGMKPPSVASQTAWADEQMVNFAAQTKLSQYAKYVDEPVVILDVETGYGWNDTVTDPTSGTVGCAFPVVTSGNYSAAANKALLSEMVTKAASVFPGYEVVVYAGGRYDWGPWFGSEAWKGGEYTFVNGVPGTPDAATGNVPAKFCRRATASPCAQFWGGQSPASSAALIWQWGSPVAPSTATMDVDQIDMSRFPIHP